MLFFKSLAKSIPYDTFSSLLDQGYVKVLTIVPLATHLLIIDIGYFC